MGFYQSTITPSIAPAPSLGRTNLQSAVSYASAFGGYKAPNLSTGSVIDPIFEGMRMDKAPRNIFTGSRAGSLYTNQPQSGQEMWFNQAGMKCAPGGRCLPDEGVPTAYMPVNYSPQEHELKTDNQTKIGTPPSSDNSGEYAFSIGAFSARNNDDWSLRQSAPSAHYHGCVIKRPASFPQCVFDRSPNAVNVDV